MGESQLDGAEGARLTGLLTAAAVTGRGVLGDGRCWTLRWGGIECSPVLVVALADASATHALATMALTAAEKEARHEELLAARWMSTPAGREPGTLVVVTTAAGVSARGEDGPGHAEGELLHRDGESGAAVFVVPDPPAGAVVVEARDRDGELVASASPARPGAGPVPTPKPEVPAALGAGFAAATLALVVAALSIAVAVGESGAARIAVAALGVLGVCTPAVRSRVARWRGDQPVSPRPVHSWVSQVVGGGGLVGAVLWADDPSRGSAALLGGLLVALAALVLEWSSQQWLEGSRRRKVVGWWAYAVLFATVSGLVQGWSGPATLVFCGVATVAVAGTAVGSSWVDRVDRRERDF